MTNTILRKDKTVNVKTKAGTTYSYKFTTLAEIHKYLEDTDQRYFAYIQRVDGDDYMFIQPLEASKDASGEIQYKKTDPPIQGAKIIPSQNVQEYGGNLTSARRFSLLMAYGLACEDDGSTAQSTPGPSISQGKGLDFEKIKTALAGVTTDTQVDFIKSKVEKAYPKMTEKQRHAVDRMCADRKDQLEFGDLPKGWRDAKEGS